MQPKCRAFKANSSAALADEALQRALARVPAGFIAKRAAARVALPEYDALCAQGTEIKTHTVAHLDLYLEAYEKAVTQAGGHVHWAATPQDANDIITGICQEAGARLVTKGKSMVTEEIALNAALEAAGYEVAETDLGEYIIQLRKETPSHIIAPAIHLSREQVAGDFRSAHKTLPEERSLDTPPELVAEARAMLRGKFLTADVGITGANFLVAETGSAVTVTNEGNGGLTQLLPRVRIVVAGIEKIVPTLSDASALTRVLARSATGQEITMYTTFTSGPRREGETDGPEAYHVVLVDKGRSELLGSEFRDILRCIRCGACMNHCPVYGAVGGHAYGWVYPGPMGSVLTPQFVGLDQASHLPNASSFCGRCDSVCPMGIPLTRLMRRWRQRAFKGGVSPWIERLSLKGWALLAKKPRLYRFAINAIMGVLSEWVKPRGSFRWLPGAGAWLKHRDLPAPPGNTFQTLWQRELKKRRIEARMRK
ncbi:MAG: LutB/LldF family L-lactate oxidation iron-sulfur protein [Alphaproteobacteria bacterium]